jgi:hypothetical protein
MLKLPKSFSRIFVQLITEHADICSGQKSDFCQEINVLGIYF